MRYAFIALFLAVICCAQEAPQSAPTQPNSSSQIPVDQANAQKAKAVLNQAIQALGGDAYLNWKDMTSEGRSYSFHHGQANSLGTLFWRFRVFPDKDRIELTKKRDVIELYVGDNGYEITYKGVRNMEHKDELDPYLRRRHYSIDIVLRQWLTQPGVALFYVEERHARLRKPLPKHDINRVMTAPQVGIEFVFVLQVSYAFVGDLVSVVTDIKFNHV